jgi:hypothetical protein|tara:strand:+ start:4477 stop:4983 length:507 start_codon:yes stop_codon:yes gene_type:complete
MSGSEKEQLLTTTIHIDSRDVYKSKSIDGLIKYKLKEKTEGFCGKHGYVVKGSVVVVKRSIGKAITHNNQSKIEYNLTYKLKTILPCVEEKYTCIIDSITKMGIIAYLKSTDDNLSNLTDSPILFIVPQGYVDDITLFSKDQKVEIEVIQNRVKYQTKQIQVVGKITK